MKTLKSTLLGLALLLVAMVAKADDPKAFKLSKDYAITTYINAISEGKMEGFTNILDQNVKFSVVRGNNVMNYERSEMIDFMKASKNTKQECTVSTTVVESNDAMTVVKVDMQYSSFVRSNYVTLTNTSNGWKITNVYSVFK